MIDIYSIYFLFKKNVLVYIGMSSNVKRRLREHGPDKYDRFRVINNVGNKQITAKYELRLIKYFKPILNGHCEDPKISTSFKIEPELKLIFEDEAKKQGTTLSYYIEQICEDYALRKKLTKSK